MLKKKRKRKELCVYFLAFHSFSEIRFFDSFFSLFFLGKELANHAQAESFV